MRGASRASALAVVAALAAAGCGGGGSAKSGVESAIRDYLGGIADKDPGRACGALTDQGKQMLARSLAANDCESALKRTFALINPQTSRVLKSAKIDVSVKGDTATARVTTAAKGQRARTGTAQLVKQHGDWKIATPLGTGG